MLKLIGYGYYPYEYGDWQRLYECYLYCCSCYIALDSMCAHAVVVKQLPSHCNGSCVLHTAVTHTHTQSNKMASFTNKLSHVPGPLSEMCMFKYYSKRNRHTEHDVFRQQSSYFIFGYVCIYLVICRGRNCGLKCTKGKIEIWAAVAVFVELQQTMCVVLSGKKLIFLHMSDFYVYTVL